MIPDILRRFAKMHRLALLAVFVSAVLSGCGSGSDNNANNGNKISYVRITNEGSSEIGFNTVISGKSFYTNENDIIAEINNLSAEYSGEPYHRKLWRYLIKNRYHFDPYSGPMYGYYPLLYLNSLGFGYCGEVAALYHNFATRAGYDARVWHLEDLNGHGHVVPEVFVNGRWELYDPDGEVYYWNEEGKVAGVVELGNNPDLITNPINPFPVTHFTPFVVTTDVPPIPYAYTQIYADLYHNFRMITDAYNGQADFPRYEYPFSLPPKAYLEFPVEVDIKLKSQYGTNVPIYDLMRLVLPKGWSGGIKLPFIFLAIKGSGSISLNNIVYNLDSPGIDNQLTINDYISQASINSSTTDIEILFVVNKRRFDLENISSFEIKNNDSSTLSVVYN